jgi:APA family basic amino acid/polyamine antiporter
VREPSLEKRLGLFDLTMIVMGSSIGSGIFLVPQEIARALPSPVAMLAVWAIGGVMTACGAVTFAELGAMMPRAGGVYVFLVLGIVLGSSATTDFSALMPAGADVRGAMAAAMVGVLWSYGGWQYATFAAGEAKHPKRDVGLSMIAGTIAVAAIYLATNVAYLRLLSPERMANEPQVASAAIAVVLGHAGAKLLAIAIIVSTLGTATIYTMTAPRIYFAMANDRVFFRAAAHVHPRFHTPALAIVLQSSWAAVLILFWGTFSSLIRYVVFTDFLFLSVAAAGVFVLRRKRPTADRPYRALGYPITPLVFIAVCVWFLTHTLLETPREALVGIAFLAAGIPVFFAWRFRETRSSRGR